MNKRFQVFVSSTYADLKDERSKVIQTIMELDCIPAGMELFPAIDNEQFDFIKKVIDDCDYYILIIGGRYGTLSFDGLSFTEKEYDYALERNIKIIAFIHENPDNIPVGKSEKIEKLRVKLVKFKEKVKSNRLVKFWNTPEELPGLVALSLSKTIRTYPAKGWVRSDSVIDTRIYHELNEVRKENAQLQDLVNKQKIDEMAAKINLADLSDEYKFTGHYTGWNVSNRSQYNGTWELSISWEKLFALLSPHLLDFPSDISTKKIIGDVIYKSSKGKTNSDTAYLNDEDFQTIKIQLSSLGLINVKYSKTTGGGAGLFWNLTDLGTKLMSELRSIRKS